jgi:flagellar protein FliS
MNTARARARFVNDGLSTVPGARLVVLLYERLVRDLETAIGALDAGRLPDAHESLTHAQDIVSELSLALDGSTWSGAADLSGLYTWLYEQLVAANVRKDTELVEHCHCVVMPLFEAWRAIQSGATAPAVPPEPIAAAG